MSLKHFPDGAPVIATEPEFALFLFPIAMAQIHAKNHFTKLALFMHDLKEWLRICIIHRARCYTDKTILIKRIQVLRLKNEQKPDIVRDLIGHWIWHKCNLIPDHMAHDFANPILDGLLEVSFLKSERLAILVPFMAPALSRLTLLTLEPHYGRTRV